MKTYVIDYNLENKIHYFSPVRILDHIMKMQNFFRVENKNFYFDHTNADSGNKAICQDAITMIESFLTYYNPENFLEDEHFFALSLMWVDKCDEYCKNLREKLKYIADSKFQKNFRDTMKKIEKQVQVINNLIRKEIDKEIIKKSIRSTIDQLTEILRNLHEELERLT